MAYRSGPSNVPPRVLVVRPQRAKTAAGFVLIGAAFLVGMLREGLKYRITSVLDVLVLLGLAALPSIFVVLGLHSWLLRVDLSLWADGVLTMKWTRWPLRPRLRTMTHADITDVVIQTTHGNEQIVVVTKTEPIPLTGSSTSDDLSRKVAEIKAFLQL
jgi:hypothetical protein